MTLKIITNSIGKKNAKISFNASNVNPLTGNSLSLLKIHPPWGDSCLVTLKNGFSNNINRIIIGTNRNQIYASQTSFGGNWAKSRGCVTSRLGAFPFSIKGRRVHASDILRGDICPSGTDYLIGSP